MRQDPSRAWTLGIGSNGQLIDRNDLVIAGSEKKDWCAKLRQIDLLPKGDKAPFSDLGFLE